MTISTEQKVIFRGRSPDKKKDYLKLKRANIRTIISLWGEVQPPENYIKNLEMNLYYLPVTDPFPPSLQIVEQSIHILNNPENLPAYIHCHAGLERTGTIITCYRIFHGINIEQALIMQRKEVNFDLKDSAYEEVIKNYSLKIQEIQSEEISKLRKKSSFAIIRIFRF